MMEVAERVQSVTDTQVCERCRQTHPKEKVKFTEMYMENLCDKCRDELAAEMTECDKQLATEGNL